MSALVLLAVVFAANAAPVDKRQSLVINLVKSPSTGTGNGLSHPEVAINLLDQAMLQQAQLPNQANQPPQSFLPNSATIANSQPQQLPPQYQLQMVDNGQASLGGNYPDGVTAIQPLVIPVNLQDTNPNQNHPLKVFVQNPPTNQPPQSFLPNSATIVNSQPQPLPPQYQLQMVGNGQASLGGNYPDGVTAIQPLLIPVNLQDTNPNQNHPLNFVVQNPPSQMVGSALRPVQMPCVCTCYA